MAFTLLTSQCHSFSFTKIRQNTLNHTPPPSFPLLKKNLTNNNLVKIKWRQIAVTSSDTLKNQTINFADELRAIAMKMHTKDQAREGEKEAVEPPMAEWQPSIEGYLKYLVDSKIVYDMLEGIIVHNAAAHPSYADICNTGLERSEALGKDLEWFKQQGYEIPEPSSPGISYVEYLKEMPQKNPQGVICHFYNVYFGHAAGGRMIGKKVAEMIPGLKDMELKVYKYEGNLTQLLQNAKNKLNDAAYNWSREEKDNCLKETEKSFKYSRKIISLIYS